MYSCADAGIPPGFCEPMGSGADCLQDHERAGVLELIVNSLNLELASGFQNIPAAPTPCHVLNSTFFRVLASEVVPDYLKMSDDRNAAIVHSMFARVQVESSILPSFRALFLYGQCTIIFHDCRL